MTTAITIHGNAQSTYVRSVLLALREKTVPYELITIGAREQRQPAHLARHPFGRVPAMEHAGFRLYETQAILRYVDEAFPGPALMPAALQARARVNQILGIIDAYGWPSMVAGIIVPRLVLAARGRTADEAAVAAAVPQAALVLEEIAGLADSEAPFLAGDAISLADMMLAPITTYLAQTKEGGEILRRSPRLVRWAAAIRAHGTASQVLEPFPCGQVHGVS